ncbi:MAG: diaminopimelate epimerase, partial [Eubacteriaceae bacterium]|nr:diaminopimelate epimerase [Eubacteriaceae bacterium]
NFKELGSFIENSPIFPEKTNVNFVQIIDLETVRLITWERGSGLTLACGTGASAVAALLYRKGLTESKIKVNVPGGQLKLETGKYITMTGPAVHVFDGIINLTEVI